MSAEDRGLQDGNCVGRYTTAGGWRLNVNTDFIPPLTSTCSELDTPVQIITDSETIECSGTILAKHSRVLKDSLEGSKELHIPDNQRVREFLSILNGGSVNITLDNFSDILKLMIIFDIPDAREQIIQALEPLMVITWDLEISNDIQVLFNGLIFCAKVSTDKTMSDVIYRPCRAFLATASNNYKFGFNSFNGGRGSFYEAIESLISVVNDKNGLIAILLHEDLFSHYIHWIKLLLDQSNYNLLIDFIETADFVATWIKCYKSITLTLLDALLDKLAGLKVSSNGVESIQVFKVAICKKVELVDSLKQMKEKGTLFSCWKMLDKDDIRYLPLLTDASDQFCVVECLLSWLHSNKPEDVSFVHGFMQQAFHINLTGLGQSVAKYRANHIETVLRNVTITNLSYMSRSIFYSDGTQLSLTLENVFYIQNSKEICISFSHKNAMKSCIGYKTSFFDVFVFPDKIPTIKYSREYFTCSPFIVAWAKLGTTASKIPLYCEPEKAYKMIQNAMKDDRKLYCQNLDRVTRFDLFDFTSYSHSDFVFKPKSNYYKYDDRLSYAEAYWDEYADYNRTDE